MPLLQERHLRRQALFVRRQSSEVDAGCKAVAVAVQPDGKIVAMGELSTRTFTEPRQEFNDFVLVRYTPDGGLDATFGSGGTVVKEFESREAFPLDMALQDDGKIIAVGSVHTYPFDPNNSPRVNLVLVSYNTDGTIDYGFGADGMVIKHRGLPSDNEAFDIIAYQGDGKFLVGGKSYQDHTSHTNPSKTTKAS